MLLAFLLTGLCVRGLAQSPMIEFTLTVTDGMGGTQELYLGLDPYATDTLDSTLGEEELPPPPPLGIFDARIVGLHIGLELGQGTVRDFRAGDSSTIGSTTHEVSYQLGDGAEIIVSCDLPPTISIRLQDIITGAIIDTTLRGKGTYNVSNPAAITRLKLTVTYFLVPLAAPVLLSPPDMAEFVEDNPTLLWRRVD